MATGSPDRRLEIRDFAGLGNADALMPRVSGDNAPFLDGLADGRLSLQQCRDCTRWRWPIAPVCPYCASTAFGWQDLTGEGTVHSWVRCHRIFYEQFAPLLPYVSLVVQLAEGVRIPGRFVGGDAEPASGMAVRAIIERWPEGGSAPAFVPTPLPR